MRFAVLEIQLIQFFLRFFLIHTPNRATTQLILLRGESAEQEGGKSLTCNSRRAIGGVCPMRAVILVGCSITT